MLVSLKDINGVSVNYNDETTGLNKDLGSELRALITTNSQAYRIDADSQAWLTLTVTPVTEIATQLVEKKSGELGSKAPPVAAVEAANNTVAKVFNLRDVTGEVVVVNTARFNANDDLTEAEKYGVVLAKLSGVDNLLEGSNTQTIQALSSSIQGEGSAAQLNTQGQALLVAGAQKVIENMGQANTLAPQRNAYLPVWRQGR